MADNSLMIRIDANIKEFRDKMQRIKDETANLEKGLATTAKVSGAAFAASAGAIALLVNESAKLETMKTRFEVLTGSVAAADKHIRDLQEFSASTPFQLEGIASASAKLQGFGFTADEAASKLQGIGDVASASGSNIEEIALIFGQVSAAGKLTGERLLQLEERATGIGDALAKTMNVPKTAIRDLVSSGQVDFKLFEKAFMSLSQEGGKAFNGMQKQSETLEGRISTLKDNFVQFSAAIGNYFLPYAKLVVTKLTEMIQWFKEHPAIAKTAAVVLAATAAISGLVLTVSLGGLAFLKLRAGLLAAKVAVDMMTFSIRGLMSATLIGGLIVGLSIVAANWETIWLNMSSFFEAFAEKVGNIAGGLGNIIKGIFTFDKEQIKQGWQQLQDGFAQTLDRTKEIKLQKMQEQHDAEMEKKAELDEAKNENRQLNYVMTEEEHKAHMQKLREQKQKLHKDEIKGADNLFSYHVAQGKKMMDFENLTNQEKVQAQANTLNNLAALQNSSNSKMKAVGKAAAITQIAISTAQGAIAAYASLAPIPIIGPALGAAAAGLLTAYGLERSARVAGLNKGGFVPGFGNTDSVPAMLTPGELVVPKEVAPTFADEMAARSGSEDGGTSDLNINFKPDEFMDWLEIELVQRGNLNLSLQGA